MRATKKYCAASAERADGVVFRQKLGERKTTPAASVSVATRNFLIDAATPPCGDARRGVFAARFKLISHRLRPNAGFPLCKAGGGNRSRLHGFVLFGRTALNRGDWVLGSQRLR